MATAYTRESRGKAIHDKLHRLLYAVNNAIGFVDATDDYDHEGLGALASQLKWECEHLESAICGQIATDDAPTEAVK